MGSKWDKFEVEGQLLTKKEICEKYGLSYSRVYQRIKKGLRGNDLVHKGSMPTGRPSTTTVNYFGKLLTVRQASEISGIKPETLVYRLRVGDSGVRLFRPSRVNADAQCLECGKMFRMGACHAQKYCSTGCSHKSRRKTKEKNCGTCGKVFTPKPANKRDKEESYCSKWCSTRSLLNVQGLYCSLPEYTHIVRAEVCGHYVIDRGIGQKYCSTKCATKHAKVKRLVDLGEISCNECGVKFTPLTGARSFCSKECAVRHSRRSHKARRRAREKGSADHCSINPYDVFVRDGWQCQGCGCDSPRKFRGTYRPDAPELDHVIPLSKGGSHTMDNLQLLCRKCNGEKGDSVNWKAA